MSYTLSDEAKKKRAEYQREYRKNNRDRINKYHAEWRKNNPDKVKEHIKSYWERKALQDKE